MDDSTPESVTIKPGNQIAFSVTNCEVTVTSVKTFLDATEYGAYNDRGGDYISLTGATSILNKDIFSQFSPIASNGNIQLASSPPKSSFDLPSSITLVVGCVAIAAVGMVVGMFAEKRRSSKARATYSAVDESSTHVASDAQTKRATNAQSTLGLV